MRNKADDIEKIFIELSESNKDLLLLIAKAIDFAQKSTYKDKQPA